MICIGISAFLSLSVLDSVYTPTTPQCIQPELTIVHQELRLVDLTSPNHGGVVERSSDMPHVRLPADGSPTRIMLEQSELIRFRSASGVYTDWLDPLSTTPLAPEAEQTPAWAMGAVWYNIFPERFDNAEPLNDQGWPYGTPVDWHADWFAVSADEFEASANRFISNPQRFSDSHHRSRPPLAEVVFERRYGGDLQGVRRRLDHIASLGTTAIWFCPVFESVSLHKYDAADHRHIDPYLAWPGDPAGGEIAEFSPDSDKWIWTPADMEFVDRLIPAVHDRGLKLILDGVWNHVGTAHPAFQNALEQRAASPYDSWFDLQYDTASQAVGWRAWDRRNGNLPAFSQSRGDLVPGPKQYCFDATTRWMDPNGDGDPSDGIDGWRLDVANEVGMRFWQDWRDHVRNLNPDAMLIGELWFDGREYFGGKAFDSQMNYPVAFALLPWLSGVPNTNIAGDLEDALQHHPATILAQMNLLASHDTARLVSLLANPGLDYDQGASMGHHGFDRSKPNKEAFERLELAYAVLTAMPGSPMIFAGDELGTWGADDPENRKPLQWPDQTADTAQAELALRTTERLSRWLRLRSDPEVGEILRYGGFRLSTLQDTLVIDRELDGRTVRLYANASNTQNNSEIGMIPARSARLVLQEEPDKWVDIYPASEKLE